MIIVRGTIVTRPTPAPVVSRVGPSSFAAIPLPLLLSSISENHKKYKLLVYHSHRLIPDFLYRQSQNNFATLYTKDLSASPVILTGDAVSSPISFSKLMQNLTHFKFKNIASKTPTQCMCF